MNKVYSASVVRERLADALDEAEKGQAVFIERRGVRFRLTVDPAETRKKRRRAAPRIEVLDAAIADGAWTWEWKPGRLTFKSPRRG
jgi:hypothetical protein